jgi:hypothetical protein
VTRLQALGAQATGIAADVRDPAATGQQSPLAAYVTGVVLPADGGWSLGGASTAMAAIAGPVANDVGDDSS